MEQKKITRFFINVPKSSQPDHGTSSRDDDMEVVRAEPADDDKQDDDVNDDQMESSSHEPAVVCPPAIENALELSKDPSRGPYRPIGDFKKREIGGRERSFCADWYADFNWLEYSHLTERAFCFPCRLFGQRSGNSEESFTKVGFNNWKKGRCVLKAHAESAVHRQAYVAWLEFKRTEACGTVVQQIDTQRQKFVEENRYYIKCITKVILLCARQDLALRGDDETDESFNRGNFREIFELLAETDPVLASVSRIGNANYLSPQIQNELLHAAAAECRDEVLQQLSNSKFALMVDGSRDSSRKEQISIAVRYVLAGVVYERFLCFEETVFVDSETLTNLIVTKLISLGLDLSNLVAQCYDGAAAMAGWVSGVQARILKLAPSAVYIHCYAHRLNLCLVDTASSVPGVTQFFVILEKLYAFFSNSTKRHAAFMSSQVELSKDKQPLEIPKLSDTRWNCRWRSVHAVKTCYQSVLDSLETIATTFDDEIGRLEAKGLLAQVSRFDFLVYIHLMDDILSVVNILSVVLQAADLNLAQAVDLVKAVQISLLQKREQAVWEHLWNDITQAAESLKISPSRGRSRNGSRRLEEYFSLLQLSVPRNLSSSEEFRREIFLPVIDKFLVELRQRFGEDAQHLMRAVDACLPYSPNFLDPERICHILDWYRVEKSTIRSELVVAKNVLKAARPTLLSMSDVIASLDGLKEGIPTLFAALNIALTLPVTTATCERSFSTLRRIKTYMRTKMTQTRLSDLAILSIEKEIASQLNLDKVIDRFALGNRRIQLK